LTTENKQMQEVRVAMPAKSNSVLPSNGLTGCEKGIESHQHNGEQSK
jgi:hypothetical protein